MHHYLGHLLPRLYNHKYNAASSTTADLMHAAEVHWPETPRAETYQSLVILCNEESSAATW